jgi:hypothetical protein
MTQAEMRDIALGAIRSQARQMNIEPETMDADEALTVLDDIYRVDPDIIASVWYGEASDNQIKMFKREWRQWQQKWQRRK